MLKRLRQSVRKHRWQWLAAMSLLGAFFLYIAFSCEACIIGELDTIRPNRLPRGCAEVRMSPFDGDPALFEGTRELPDGMEEKYDHLAVRKSQSVRDAYYVASASTVSKRFEEYKGKSESHYSARKWMFVLAAQDARSRVSSRDGVTEEDWARAVPMKMAPAAWDWPQRFEANRQGIRFHGRVFPRTRDYLLNGAPLISTGERWITVLSGSGWFPRGGEVLSPDFLLEQIYHPARHFSVATYDANSAELVREIHGWGCYGLFDIRDGTTWYDDELLFVPSEGPREMVCRF